VSGRKDFFRNFLNAVDTKATGRKILVNGLTGITVSITQRDKALVGKIASNVYKHYCPAGQAGQIEFDDLFNLGIIGLLEAKTRFDPNRGIPFQVYASSRIRGAMLDQIRYQPIIRISQELAQKIKMLKKTRISLFQMGQQADDKNVADKLGWSIEEVRNVLKHSVHVVPVMESVEKESDGSRGYWGEIIADKSLSAENMVIINELAACVQKCLENLPSDEYRIVLLGRVIEELNLRELADVLNCSNQTVANRQEKARELMKNCLEKNGWTLETLHEIQNEVF
jgi:RNA polymerase sigma factor FliA